jgi:predicted AAA+ superfamily ATPase
MFCRFVQKRWARAFATRYVHLVFGARQTGKSTLLRALLPNAAVWLDFSLARERLTYLRDPDRLVQLCRALPRSRRASVVVVDEAQNVPPIFDAVQHLYDSDQDRWRFVLCGSSARKLRATGANLLPGRCIVHHLHPLIVSERPFPETEWRAHGASPLPAPERSPDGGTTFPATELIERLTFGELPGIALARRAVRADVLRAYTSVYLEEELRREALIKDWAAFSRFLELAAAESGQMVNYAKVSREAGVSLPTVKSYYQLLEDMFIGFRVAAFSASPRKNLLSTPRFFFFDLGVRHAAAGLPIVTATVRANPGPIFEQWVGIEIWKRLRYRGAGKLHYLRSKAGAEVDFIIETGRRLTPLEVKWTESPTIHDARHVLAFLAEQPRARRAFIVCRCPRPLQLHPRVDALPWFRL